jgi:2-amino-4-hydroxy-6-hydroxymethyldihydropteridine diphosphokinase
MYLSPTPRTRCLIALGSNLGSDLGDRLENLRAGVAGIDDAGGIEVVTVSPLYETAPVGGPENQGPYLNAALTADTTLDAADVLALLHRIEADRERQRVVHWGPRTLDLDLLVHGDVVSDAETLEVPHPRMHQRRFVMVPVCDIAPDLVHPRLGRTMRDLLADLPVELGDLTRLADTWHEASHTVPPSIPEPTP